MRVLVTHWTAGCTATFLAFASPAFAQPSSPSAPPSPQTTEERQTETGADAEQLFERANDEHTSPRQQAPASEAGREDRDPEPPQPTGPHRLPAGFERLGLSEQEQAHVMRVIEEHDRKIQEVLGRFAELHVRTISAEAINLAQQMREGQTELADAPERRQQRTAGFRPGDAESPNAESPNNDARPNNDGDQPGDASEGRLRDGRDPKAEQIREAAAGTPLEGPASEAWQQLHALHLEAVRLEAQKLVALERLLPEEKLQELHRTRNASSSPDETRAQPNRPDLQDAPHPEEERRAQEGARTPRGPGEVPIEREGDQVRPRDDD